jgi:hypothetical protein
MDIKPGCYHTPCGTLEVRSMGRGTCVSFFTSEPESYPVFYFDEEGTFHRFEVHCRSTTHTSGEGTIFACEHIAPGYEGRVYCMEGLGGEIIIRACPQCIVLEAKVAGGEKLNVLPRELWELMLPKLTVVELPGKEENE